jgi:AMMECR1 domain-containing protein
MVVDLGLALNSSYFSQIELFKCLLFSYTKVGKHGLIIEFTDPDYNIRRSATYLPDVPAHEGNNYCTIAEDCFEYIA